jgi:predicted flap endonuclease-1-like 5' DNA nuclease
MSSFFWLLLYLAPLLGLTAVIFAWLGWKWRGTDLSKIIQELQTRLDDINAARSAGEVAHDTLRRQILAAEDGLRTSRDELHAAQEANRLSLHEFIQVQESSRALQTEHAKTLQELETLRTERDHVSAALAAAQTESAPAEKPKRKRPSTASPPKTADIAPRSAGLQGTLAAHAPSLADSETRLQSTAQEIERLKNQAHVLQRVTENAAALAGTPDDDLTRIKGIKNVISEKLRAHGIRTWRQIAQWNDEELSAFSEILAFKNRATREQWKEQARALHEAAHGPLS